MANRWAGEVTVRTARPGERAVVTATVAAAFASDPAWSYILGGEYDRLSGAFAGTLFDLRVDGGDVWVSDDLSAVAMWEPPAGPRLEPAAVQRLWQGYRDNAGDRAWQAMRDYDQAVAAARPSTPYWYLGVLATHPDRRGRGLATAVIGPVLAQADHDAVACCLETSTAANRAFYKRRGFTQATQVAVPGGPTTWWLTRPPALTRGG
jgi:GNAT superfamily N-acetyltransferase